MRAAAICMTYKGGEFVKALGKAWLVADATNRAKLEQAFADYFANYSDIAEKYSAFSQGVEL